jgi:hypothetical protein
MNLIKLVKRRQTRGSIEHFYTARVRPRMYDDTWSRIPSIVKRAIIGGRLSQLGKEVFAAAQVGGFDRDEIHLTRTRMTLTRKGWEEASQHFATVLERFDEIKARDAARIEADPSAAEYETTAVMMLFEAPSPSAIEQTAGATLPETDSLEDVVPLR